MHEKYCLAEAQALERTRLLVRHPGARAQSQKNGQRPEKREAGQGFIGNYRGASMKKNLQMSLVETIANDGLGMERRVGGATPVRGTIELFLVQVDVWLGAGHAATLALHIVLSEHL